MTGLDTNLLVRFITQDDPVQAHKATHIIEEQLTAEQPGFVSVACILEMVWVLKTAYGLTDSQLAHSIQRVLQVKTFIIQNEKQVYSAMLALKTGQGTFADALIGALGLWAGCTSTLTFDRKAARLDGFELVS